MPIQEHADYVQLAVRDAQKGRGPGVLGGKNQSPQKFDTLDDRLLAVISVLMVGYLC